MQSLSRKLLTALTLAITLSCSGCAVNQAAIAVPLPQRPALLVCPDTTHPDVAVVEGGDNAKGAFMMLKDLFDYVQSWKEREACELANQELLAGYAIKLENRLKAVGGK